MRWTASKSCDRRAAPFANGARRARRGSAPWTTAMCLALVIAAAAGVDRAEATRVKDLTHLKGRRENHLIGYGLVVGLAGTGDGGKYETSIITLAKLLENLQMPVPPAMLRDTKNVAVVLVEATIPDNGVREGDKIDAQVSSIGVAKSLVGGMLVMTPLQGPGRDEVFALARGRIEIPPDAKVKTTGAIKGGAVMEADVIHNYVDETWAVTFVLEDDFANFSWATAIADRINEHVSEVGQVRRVATAVDAKNVVVRIPEPDRDRPAHFIANVESLELFELPPNEAKVIISRRTGTLVISGEVEIGPAVISHNGMSITTVQPPPKPTEENPLVREEYVAPISAPRTSRGAARLRELVDALNQLNVPSREIIEIIENLHRGGQLKGKLEYRE